MNEQLKRLLFTFQLLGTCSCNEAVDFMWEEDKKTNKIIERGWRYYVHMNKLPDKLMVKGYIVEHGAKKGSNGRREKTWEITEEGLKALKLFLESLV